MSARGERGSVAIGAVALLLVLALVAGAALVAGRGLLLDERTHGSADAVALAAASVLELRYGGDIDGGGARASVRATESAARAAAWRVAERLGATLVSIEFERGPRDPSPLAVRVTVRLSKPGPAASARAGIGFAQPAPAVGFRIADVRGLDAAGAVVAAALAQLGWPYVWGGESRAEGGFDCSGLVDYALAAAGRPVGRLDAAGLQRLAQPLAAGAGLLPGDLVFVGLPAHHVGLVVAPGLAVEAPHRGAQVRVEPLGDGGWTGAGRILPPAAGGGSGDGDLVVPAYVPVPLRTLVARAARAEQLPPALLAAQLEAESGFDPRPSRRPARRASRSSCPLPGAPAGIRSASAARSSPARRSPPRRGSCTTCSSARRAMSPRRSRPTTPAPWCSGGRGRVRHGPTSRG